MPSSSAQSPSKRRPPALKGAISESQLRAYFLARETLRRLKGLAITPASAEAAPQGPPPGS